MHTAVGGNPQVADLVGAEGVDMVVDKCGAAVGSQRVNLRRAVLDACESVAFGTYPETAVGGGCHARHLHAGQSAFIADDSFVAGAVPDVPVGILCDGCDVTQMTGSKAIDILSAVGYTRFLSTHP